MFQTLLQKWQDKLNTNWNVNYEFEKIKRLRHCKYQRKMVMEDPSIIMSLLNTQIVDIKANSRFAAYISSEGSLFVMGRDFKPQLEKETSDQGDATYGIPKLLSIQQKISDV